MAGSAEDRQPDQDQIPSSWTSKLSKRLSRRSNGENGSEKRAGKRAERAPASSNPFARNYVPPAQLAAAKRAASIDQQRSRPGTASSSAGHDSSSIPGDRTKAARASMDRSIMPSSSAGSSSQKSPASSSNQKPVSPKVTDLDDDFIGLDMKGRPRRKSDLKKQRVTPETSAPSPNPFARPSGSTPASRFFRRSLDKAPGEHQETKQSGNDGTESSAPVTEKTTGSGLSEDTSKGRILEETSLPFHARSKDSETRTLQSSPRGVPHALGNALAVVNAGTPSTADTDVNQAGDKMNRLAFQNPEVLSPASFVSAESYFEPKAGERCEDFKGQPHPSAQDIIDRAKFDSVDTTTHERVAPAVTHETIQPQVHEITQEHLTRDVHHYHHVHRLLPVHEVEILPAKHYRIVNGVQVEMDAEQVPQSRIDAWQSAIIPKVQA